MQIAILVSQARTTKKKKLRIFKKNEIRNKEEIVSAGKLATQHFQYTWLKMLLLSILTALRALISNFHCFLTRNPF